MSVAILTKAVAIFGATSDIALAVARLYAGTGAALVLVGRDRDALDAIQADLKVRGAKDVVVRHTDFMAINELPALVDAVWQSFGPFEVALIGYGSLPDQTALQGSAEETAAALTLNFVSPAALIGALAQKFESQQRGTIAVISSVAGDRGRQSNYIYGAAKGGLQRFLEGLRHRLAGTGVAVLDIRPGFVSTKMTEHLSQEGPLWATPDKVAEDIIKAIDRKKAVLYTPWFWRLIMLIVRSLPRTIIHRTKL